ncbi:MAG: hypothetical protein HZC48_00125 [Nitrospirae bacterium]|nr:hypothetical protein [Nitrospirota bacterium]
MKQKMVSFWMLFLFIVGFNCTSYALDVETHRAINEYISSNTLNGFSLSDYLNNNLGFTKGKEEEIKGQKVYKWFSDGGHYEDKPPWYVPYLRSVNHFHDPLATSLSDAGFNGIWDTGFLSGLSAVEWSQWPLGAQTMQVLGSGNYSWYDVRDYYYKVLTSVNNLDRENKFAETFRGLGQLMHLVEDMSVPEHARNDGHYKYAYEEYVRDNAGLVDSAATMPIFFDKTALGQPSVFVTAAPIPIANLFDTNQYSGPYPNPNVTMNLAIDPNGNFVSNIGLSEYTNANFLSPDSMFTAAFPYPNWGSVVEHDETISGKKRTYLRKLGKNETEAGKTGNGEHVEHLAVGRWGYKLLPSLLKQTGIYLKMDEQVYSDYAEKLIPRAVGYSAGLLDYFFRGDIDMVPDDTLGYGYVIVNNTEEDMDGTFELYYDNSHDVRTKLSSYDLTLDTFSSGNNKSGNINFTWPNDAVKYILVFRGRLGNEEDAVVGRVRELDRDFLFLVNLDLQQTAFEIKTVNHQYQLIPASKDINITPYIGSTLLTVQSHPDKKEHKAMLPFYVYYADGIHTSYYPDIKYYGTEDDKLINNVEWGNVVVGFPQAYIPSNFTVGSPYVWDSGFAYGEWVSNNRYPYVWRLASYIHGRRPFEVVDNRLVAKNINIRKNDAYTYYDNDYTGPFHIQYKDESGDWVRGIDLPSQGGADTMSWDGFDIICTTTGDIFYSSHYEKSCELETQTSSRTTPLQINYLAILNEDINIYQKTNVSNSSLESDGGIGTGTFNWDGIYWEDYYSGVCTRETGEEIFKFIKIGSSSNSNSDSELYVGDIMLDRFEINTDETGGVWKNFGRSINRTYYVGSCNSPPSNSRVWDNFSLNNSSTTVGKSFLSVMDYDYYEGDKYFILFYKYDEKNDSGTGVITGLGPYSYESDSYESYIMEETGYGESYDNSYSTKTRYKLAYKIDGQINSIELPYIGIWNRHQAAHSIGIDCASVEDCLIMEETANDESTGGQQITGVSLQINDKNMVYTYIIKRYDNGNWVFDKRIIGIINISDNALPIGHRQEFELDFSGINFDPSSLSAIGVTR